MIERGTALENLLKIRYRFEGIRKDGLQWSGDATCCECIAMASRGATKAALEAQSLVVVF